MRDHIFQSMEYVIEASEPRRKEKCKRTGRAESGVKRKSRKEWQAYFRFVSLFLFLYFTRA